MLVDADMESFKGASYAHCMHLDPTGTEKGIAALPALAAHRTISALDEIDQVLTNAELVVILTGLGGGTGTGSTPDRSLEFWVVELEAAGRGL
mgnify:CR=1 FL=1